MDDKTLARLRAINGHARVGIGNDTPMWLKPRRTVWGVTLDGRYHGQPRCRTIHGAMKKAEALIEALESGTINV